MNEAIPSEYLMFADSVCKRYPDGNVQALHEVSVGIRPGEFLAIMGPSGSGKSTLLNLLGALDRPDAGEVYFRGEPLSKCRNLDQFRARQIGFVFQSFFLLPTLTACENVQIPMFEGPRLTDVQRVRRAEELLELVGMSHRRHHRPMQLSIGERQRVALARALANDPPLLLADEPTGNLDSQTAADIMDLLVTLQRDREMAMVIVTHSPEIGERADRLVRLRDGRIEEDRLLRLDEPVLAGR